MDTHLLALQLMAAQGLLGAFDTLYHHEMTEALPQRRSASKELSIHAIRSLLYSLMFIGLSAWVWHGVWALALLLLFVVAVADVFAVAAAEAVATGPAKRPTRAGHECQRLDLI